MTANQQSSLNDLIKKELLLCYSNFVHRVALLNGVNNVLTFQNVSENGMMTIQPRRSNVSNKELRSVRVRSCVRHAQHARSVVSKIRMEFVVELVSRTAAAGACRVAALNHKVLNHTMEF